MNHRVMSHDSGVEMVKAMLKHQGKSEKTNNGVSRTSFICATCCPYLPLLGKRCFKMDSRRGPLFGVVMEISGMQVGAETLASGTTQYSVEWFSATDHSNHRSQVSSTEARATLETYIRDRELVDTKYRVEYRAQIKRARSKVHLH